MPRNHAAKTAARAYMAEHGVPYSEAVRQLAAPSPSAFGNIFAPEAHFIDPQPGARTLDVVAGIADDRVTPVMLPLLTEGITPGGAYIAGKDARYWVQAIVAQAVRNNDATALRVTILDTDGSLGWLDQQVGVTYHAPYNGVVARQVLDNALSAVEARVSGDPLHMLVVTDLGMMIREYGLLIPKLLARYAALGGRFGGALLVTDSLPEFTAATEAVMASVATTMLTRAGSRAAMPRFSEYLSRFVLNTDEVIDLSNGDAILHSVNGDTRTHLWPVTTTSVTREQASRPFLVSAWEDTNCYAVVVGTEDAEDVVEAWNAHIKESYKPETVEFREGIISPVQVRMHWRMTHVALPLPNDERPFSGVAPGPGTIPVWSADYSKPALGFLAEEDCVCPRNSFDCLSPSPGDDGCAYCSDLDSEASCPQDPDYIEAVAGL